MIEKTKISGIYKQKLKSGDISYFGNFRHPLTKKPIRKKLGTKLKDNIKNEKEALSILNNIIKDYKINPTEKINYKNNITLNNLAELYFKDREEKKKRELIEQYSYLYSTMDKEEFFNLQITKKRLYNTTKEKLKFLKNVSDSKLYNLEVNRILKTDTLNFLEKHLLEKNLASKTKFDLTNKLKTIINYGIKKDIINIKTPFNNLKVKNPRRQCERVLTKEEITLLLKESFKTKDKNNIFWCCYMGVLTGARSDTILNIKVKDLDLKNKFISLYNFKSKRKYRLNLTDESVEFLSEKIKNEDLKEEDYLIRHVKEFNRIKYKNKPLSQLPDEIYELMDKLFNQGLNKKDNDDRDKVVNFHTLRRSVATNMVKDGALIYDVMIFLNHSNIEQTMQYLNLSTNNLHTNLTNFMNDIFEDFE